MSEKILLINIHSSRNIGDAALLQVTLQQLRKNFPSIELTLCMDDPDSHTGSEKKINSIFSWAYPFRKDEHTGWNYLRLIALLPATLLPLLGKKVFDRKIWLLTPKSMREIVNAYLDADLVVSKPGGFLYSSGRGVSLLIAVYSILYAYLAGKPVYMLPQSVGPLKHKWERLVVRWLLERIRIVMVREPISFQLIKDIGVKNKQCYLIPDLAFGLADAGQEAGSDWLRAHGINTQLGFPLLGMTMINWGEQNSQFDQQSEYEMACGNTVRYFVNKINGRVIIFPQVWGPLPSQDDRIPAHRLLARLSDLSGAVTVIDEPVPAELLKSIYGWMDLFIGSRMHSNIFALSKGVPVIAIGYLHKTEGIARMVGIEKWVIEIHQMQGDALQEKLVRLWSERRTWRDRIQQVIPDLVQETERAGKMVANDYFENWKLAKGG
jgi:colanic acid/amylovoran biosynthesis protein